MLEWFEERICYLFRHERTTVPTPRRILIFAPGSLRTAIAALSPVQFLAAQFPEAMIGMVVSTEVMPLLRFSPAISVLFPFREELEFTHYRADSEDLTAWNSFEADWIITTVPHCARLIDRLEAPVKAGFCYGLVDSEGKSGWQEYASHRSDGWRSYLKDLTSTSTVEVVPTLELPAIHIEVAEEVACKVVHPILLLQDSGRGKFWTSLKDRLEQSRYLVQLTSDPNHVVTVKKKLLQKEAAPDAPKPKTSSLDVLSVCQQASLIITANETTASIASIGGLNVLRIDSADALWEGDRSTSLPYRNELDTDLANVMRFIRESLPEPPLPTTSEELVDEPTELSPQTEFEAEMSDSSENPL